MTHRGRDVLLLVIVCVALLLTAWPFLIGMGIEVDEALAGSGIYHGMGVRYSWRIAGNEIPLMILSYLGATKVWLSAPLFAVWGPNELTLRLPTILLGGATVPLLWCLLRPLSRSAALIAAVLLATDTSYLLLTAIDYGPVAVQVFLKTAVMCLLAHWSRSHKDRLFLLAFFLIGVALWDKAIFIWNLVGMAAGAAVVFPHQTKQALTLRRIGMAVIGLCVGACPLIMYNIKHPLDTFRSNATFSFSEIPAKASVLLSTMNGSILHGFYTADDPPPRPRTPKGVVGVGSVGAWKGLLSFFRRNWTVTAFGAATLLVPIFWRTPARSAATFGIVSLLVAWIAMAGTSGAGAAAHHVVLLWPTQFIVIGAMVGELSRRHQWRSAVVAVAFALPVVNLSVTAGYYQELLHNGPGIRWTQASMTLKEFLDKAGFDRIFIVDWGVYETLALLSKGSMPLLFANEYTSKDFTTQRAAILGDIMRQSKTVFITHVPRYEQLHGVNAALESFAQRMGNRKSTIATIYDEFGRDVFLVLQFHSAAEDAQE